MVIVSPCRACREPDGARITVGDAASKDVQVIKLESEPCKCY